MKCPKVMNNKTTIIVQARMGSTRLPGKVLKKLNNHTILGFLIKRLEKAKSVKKIVIATSDNKEDDLIVNFCKENEIDYFRGPEENVYKRFLMTAEHYGADNIVRISGDCPFSDWIMIDRLSEIYFKYKADFVTNMYKQTFPLGFAVEIFKFERLKELKNLNKNEKEHVTTHFINNPENYNFISVERNNDLSKYRMTLDTTEDYEVLKKIAANFSDIYFEFKDIERLINQNPSFLNINSEIKQKSNFQITVSDKINSVKYEETH